VDVDADADADADEEVEGTTVEKVYVLGPFFCGALIGAG
jgi:hypothetical protein